MSEEEIEAIKYLEFLSNEKCECEACQHAKKEYKIILNLLGNQQKEIEYLKEVKHYYEISTISKDKIREKIKELELDQENKSYMTEQGIKIKNFAIKNQIDILQELLEED